MSDLTEAARYLIHAQRYVLREVRHILHDLRGLDALLGVGLGFMLGEGSRLWRERRRVHHLRRALKAECESIIAQVSDFEDILNQAIASLQAGRVLPGEAVRAVGVLYPAVFAELAPHLEPVERNLLHVVYERLRVGDETLATYEQRVVEMLPNRQHNLQFTDPMRTYINRLTELRQSYGVVRDLLQSFLDGAPIDVFGIAGPRGERVVLTRRRRRLMRGLRPGRTPA